jgi:voltage-gated sodium channel
LSVRKKLQRVVEARAFQHTITTVIVVNAATLGAATSARWTDRFGELLGVLDTTALGVFVVEMLAKLYVYRLRFFRDPWNCFDLSVVGVALLPAAGAFSVLRALRVLRMLRLISAVPSMRRVVSTLLAAIPGVASILGLLVLMVYVSAVLGTTLFAEASPRYFGDLGRSLWTLFQVMTGEAWPDVAADVMDEQPWAWAFFLVFILVSTFVVLNLFLAVMVSAMEAVRDSEGDAAHAAETSVILTEIAALRQEVVALREQLGSVPVPRSGR